ncbi:hypothetical protein [Paenibacillus sp.]|uniref:hypothetical protein n=1 Tax=Paenibacillus sp. TaxID=58172 RepID=UPI0028126B63|nr:hypothetical protein [Paenibacillus sp.]
MTTSLRFSTLELCICRPAPDLPDADFRKALRAADDFLAGCAGFEGRELLYSASSDRWIDLVRWASPDAAEAAMDAFGHVEALQPLASRLVDATMLRLSRLPELAVCGKTAGAGDAPVYEVIAYRLKPGIEDADYRRTLDAFGAALSAMDGFLGRDVFRDASSGTWAEVIRYADQPAVDRLGPVVMSLPEAAAAMERIDAETVELLFATQVRSS